MNVVSLKRYNKKIITNCSVWFTNWWTAYTHTQYLILFKMLSILIHIPDNKMYDVNSIYTQLKLYNDKATTINWSGDYKSQAEHIQTNNRLGDENAFWIESIENKRLISVWSWWLRTIREMNLINEALRPLCNYDVRLTVCVRGNQQDQTRTNKQILTTNN